MGDHWACQPAVMFPRNKEEASTEVPVSVNLFEELTGQWLSSYDITKIWRAAELLPSASMVLPQLHAAKVYDAAVKSGAKPCGIAPANSRRGKYTHSIPGNPQRMYCGPAKLPYQAGTKFSFLKL
jgi:hypothetical protein